MGNCDICGSDKPVEKKESILVRAYFSYCNQCRDNYVEKKEVIMDFIKNFDSMPNWFSDVKYYDNGEYKKAKKLI